MSTTSGTLAPRLRVEQVRVTPVAFPDPPLLSAFGLHDPYALRAIVELDCGADIIGLGETYGDIDQLTALRTAAGALVGLDPFDLADLRTRLGAALPDGPRPGSGVTLVGASRVFRAAHSALEVACLDAQGQRLGLSVSDLLGGRARDTIAASGYLFFHLGEHPGSSGSRPAALGPEALVEQARDMVGRYGFTALKLKGGVLDPEVEIATLEALAEAFPDTKLRFDPNCSWSVEDTVGRLPRLEAVLDYLEDPVDGCAAMGEVARRTRLPLATNMCTVRFDDVPMTVAQGSISVLLLDHHFWGGLRASAAVSAIGETFGWRLSMHSNSHLGISLAAMVHSAATQPALTYAIDTHWPWKPAEDDVVDVDWVFDHGAVAVPDGPGLGVRLDRERLARLNRRYEEAGQLRTDQAAYIRSVPHELVEAVRPVVRGW